MKSIKFSFVIFILVLISGACCSETSTPNDALTIVATVTIKNAADKADVEKAMFAVVEGTRTEKGNISYVLHQDVSNPMVYTFIEVWKSQAAIDSHNASAHFKTFLSAIDGKIDLSVITMKMIK